MKQIPAFKGEVFVDGEWASNSVRWPTLESAEKAAADLYSRWTLTTDYRAVEVPGEEPNRPSWEEWIDEHGLPPRRVSLANMELRTNPFQRKGETDGTR